METPTSTAALRAGSGNLGVVGASRSAGTTAAGTPVLGRGRRPASSSAPISPEATANGRRSGGSCSASRTATPSRTRAAPGCRDAMWRVRADCTVHASWRVSLGARASRASGRTVSSTEASSPLRMSSRPEVRISARSSVPASGTTSWRMSRSRGRLSRPNGLHRAASRRASGDAVCRKAATRRRVSSGSGSSSGRKGEVRVPLAGTSTASQPAGAPRIRAFAQRPSECAVKDRVGRGTQPASAPNRAVSISGTVWSSSVLRPGRTRCRARTAGRSRAVRFQSRPGSGLSRATGPAVPQRRSRRQTSPSCQPGAAQSERTTTSRRAPAKRPWATGRQWGSSTVGSGPGSSRSEVIRRKAPRPARRVVNSSALSCQIAIVGEESVRTTASNHGSGAGWKTGARSPSRA